MNEVTVENPRRVRRKSSRQSKLVRKANVGNISSFKNQAISIEVAAARDVALIHDAVLKILSEIGVIIEHDEARNLLLRNYGCQLGEDGYVRIRADLVGYALSTVPRHIKLYDLNGNVRVDTAAKFTAFCPGHNCVHVRDHRTGSLRKCTLNDIKETAIVCEQLPNINMVCSLGYPSDIDAEDEAVETVRTMFAHSCKPAAVLAHDDLIQARIFEHLASLSGGFDNLADKPIAIELMGPVSPLKLPDEFCQRLINGGRRRVPIVCYPASFPGMSCPISVAGAIAQSSAEAIAGIVLHQIYSPGAPILSGSAVLPMDMRQADIAYGSPEYMLNGLGAADYFNYLNIPSWIGAGCSDSHDFDTQAAAEAGANMAIAALASTPFVHNLGYLSGGQTGSLEMLVLCDELAGWANQMAAGCEVSPETIAIDVVKRSAPDNSFLTDQHTQERYLTENWYPTLFERSNAEAWTNAGGRSAQARIREKLHHMLGG